jgi:hypothetical protein
MDQPVFVLSAGGRTGSTLVQRLFISTKQILVWGEHNGLLVRGLGEVTRGMANWSAYQRQPGRSGLRYRDKTVL